MRVREFKAIADPSGGRIDLSWINPDAMGLTAPFKGIKLLRRESTGAAFEDKGTAREILDDTTRTAGERGHFEDSGLRGNTVYYYAIVAYDTANNFGPLVHASELATTSYQTADVLYRELPALYQRLDTAAPALLPLPDPADQGKGQLRRFIEMFGPQLDLLRSYARAMPDFFDRDRVDGALLPLLANWIGWQTDYTLPFGKQRNEVGYAPHYFRNTGTAANLRATINRLTTWDAQVKEFVHNIFLTNTPQQLVIYEKETRGTDWLPAKVVTLDAAYEGSPAAVRSNDGRDLIFYHASQRVSSGGLSGSAPATQQQWHLWFKEFDQREWLAARRLSFDGDINKYPAVIQRRDGKWWLAWSSYRRTSNGRAAEIRVRPFDIGRRDQPARLQIKPSARPIKFTDGETLLFIVKNGGTVLGRSVTVHQEHFGDIAAATSTEVATLLDRELPGVKVQSLEDGTISLTTLTAGNDSDIDLVGSVTASKLGTSIKTSGTSAQRARIVGNSLNVAVPFGLADGDTLLIGADSDPPRLVTFNSRNFVNIGAATAKEVAAEINRVLPGLADVIGNRIRLTSLKAGEQSFITVDVNASTAAAKLGFGQSLPGTGPIADDTEPAVFEDNANNLWLFWSSRRSDGGVGLGRWRIWYNRCTAAGWGDAKPLTSGVEADNEPAVVFDPAGGAPTQGKIWVFWTRKKRNGRSNIFFRTTTKVDFDTLVELDWTETELMPAAGNSDRLEAAPLLLRPDNLELYFSSNEIDGWQIWMTALTPIPSVAPTQITTGQFTHRAAAAIRSGQARRLFFRTDESQVYVSAYYPASQTIDARYAGSTTVDTRNPAKIGMQGNVQDVTTYTYDNGKRPLGLERKEQLYSRDTIGIYLTPDTADEKLIIRKQGAIANAVRSFLPIQIRVVFIVR